MIPPDWTPHRRDDGERVGWIRPDGDGWVAVDVLGREASGRVEWLDAEAALEAKGIGWLADVWMLDGEGPEPLQVRVVEVIPEASLLVVHTDDYGAIDVPVTRYELPWPAPARLRQRRAEDRDDRSPFG